MTAPLCCTSAPNDRDLVKCLGSLALVLPIEFGDCVFYGVDDSLSPIQVCCERKKILDMTNSIIGGRYLHQAQAAKDAGMDVLVLIVEGQIRPNPVTGLLETISYHSGNTRRRKSSSSSSSLFGSRVSINPGSFKSHPRKSWEMVKPGIPYSRFDQYLTELDYLAGVIVKRSSCVQETAAIIKSLWVNFQTPPSKHNSLHQIYSAPNTRVTLCVPGLVKRMAKEIDGVGWVRASAVAEKFHSVKEMVDADVKTWMSVEGIGRKTAEKAVNSLRGGC